MSNPPHQILAIEHLLKWSSPETVLTLNWVAASGAIYCTCTLQDGREIKMVHGTLRGLFDELARELKFPYLTMF